MNTEYIFRQATVEDQDEILALYHSVVGTEFCAWTMEYPSKVHVDFDLSRDALFCMRDLDGQLMGVISIDEDDNVNALDCWSKELVPSAELSRLGVATKWHNQGVARALITEVSRVCKERGYQATRFMVAKSNTKALRSYAKLEYTKVGQCHMYDCDYWCYEKEIQ